MLNFYLKCSLFGFLFVFKNIYRVATTEDVSMGEIVKFVSVAHPAYQIWDFSEN